MSLLGKVGLGFAAVFGLALLGGGMVSAWDSGSKVVPLIVAAIVCIVWAIGIVALIFPQRPR